MNDPLTLDTEISSALRRRRSHRLPSGVEVVDIYGGVGGGYMMSLDGRLFEWGLDFDEREVTDRVRIRLALVVGSKAVPELRRLVPDRPPGAVDCEECRGTGTAVLNEQATWACNPCGGVGWRDAP
jgi:hypothetical protein